jgi:hypothetical protein
MYGQQTVDMPVSNPVIYGKFPKFSTKKSCAEKLNKFLSRILLVMVALSFVSYHFVFDSEKTMNTLGREIDSLNNENIELQSKLDNLHSFNRVDKIIHSRTLLDTAQKVIEIPAVNVSVAPQLKTEPVNYFWSIGY